MEKIKNMKKIREKTSVSMILLCTVLTIYTISFLALMLWTLLVAMRSDADFSNALKREDWKQLLSFKGLTFKSFSEAWKGFTMPNRNGEPWKMPQMFLHAIMYAGGCAVIATLVACLMAYVTARYNYTIGKIVYAIVLVTMAIPIVGSLPSEMEMVDNLGLMDSVFALYILKANFLGLYFLIFHAQFKMIPKDYTEAAGIDGASELRIMLQVIFPMAIGTITTVMLLNFIAFWNDYQTPMIYWNSNPVISYGLWYNSEMAKPTPEVLAGMLLVAAPILVAFGIFNKKVMSNMSIGGVKG